MAIDYDFRILIETYSGSQYAYGTASLLSVESGQTSVATSGWMHNKIQFLPSSSYVNSQI